MELSDYPIRLALGLPRHGRSRLIAAGYRPVGERADERIAGRRRRSFSGETG